MKNVFLAAALLLACTASNALEVIVGHVTYLEPTYMPAFVQFTLDAGSAACPAGGFLKWQKSDASNNKVAYATLLVALSTGARVRLFLNDGDTTCIGQFLHVVSN